ncbi:MAG: ABC transporter permease [Gemmatimonadota bacterium]|nr:MAG: ABC transporter permease [Gemmatimonadota bacterium]
MTHPLLTPIQSVGRATLALVRASGQGGYLAAGAVRALKNVDIWAPHISTQMYKIGVASVPIAMFVATFTGIVLALQASYTLTGGVPEYFVGTLVGKTMILELGPVLTGLALAGRVGASIAAELGTMRVTEQIDALETLAYDPLAYLVVPRVVAGVLMFPVVVALAISIGVVAGWVTSMGLLDMGSPQFVKGLKIFFDPFDVTFAMIKSVSFGLIVTGVGSFFGFHTMGGAEGVGHATTRTVVVSTMLILVLDAFWAAVLL